MFHDKDNTLIIIDWDDTLFPTSFINNVSNFNNLDNLLYMFLNYCSSLGHLVIITNAKLEWINTCLKKLPQTNKIQNKFKIVSARDQNEHKFHVNQWKENTFKNYAKSLFLSNNYINIISIGDAHYEYNALQKLYHHMPQHNKIFKSVKFIGKPTIDHIIDQIDVLQNNIENICKKHSHIDMQFVLI